MNETLSAYVGFLWEQFQYDWSWLSNPWLLGVGHVLYLIFFTVKWMVLLAPITIPITIWKWPIMQRPVYVVVQDGKKNKGSMPNIYNN